MRWNDRRESISVAARNEAREILRRGCLHPALSSTLPAYLSRINNRTTAQGCDIIRNGTTPYHAAPGQVKELQLATPATAGIPEKTAQKESTTVPPCMLRSLDETKRSTGAHNIHLGPSLPPSSRAPRTSITEINPLTERLIKTTALVPVCLSPAVNGVLQF